SSDVCSSDLGYLLIENGKETAVQKVTDTKPMSKDSVQEIVDTAIAGELLGMKLIYLEAGSGAIHPISSNIISSVQKEIKVPLIVGGGIRSDRKSTRLNSSHVKISYAVFCL